MPNLHHPAPSRATTASATRPALSVDREDLDFHTLAPGLVQVTVRIRNLGETATPLARLTLRAAPLGAFLESEPVAQLALRALRPGQSEVVQTELRTPYPGEVEADRSSPSQARMARSRARRLAQLPEDTLRELHPARIAWAGNFDVLIDEVKLTERHEATSLPLIPGRTNYAVFEVGDRKDDYRFSFRGPGQHWEPRLTAGAEEAMRAILGTKVSPGGVLPPHQWLTSRPGGAVTLSFRPPKDAQEGLLAVAVGQRSTGREALVEFAFGTDRIPRGCFDR